MERLIVKNQLLEIFLKSVGSCAALGMKGGVELYE